MASLIELFEQNKKQYEIKNKGDKTPLTVDGGKDLIGDDVLVDTARGGAIDKKKYSDTVKY